MVKRNIEAAIQAATIRWVHENYPDVMITATSNEKHYKSTEQIGSAGITDLILFYDHNNTTYVLFLELKKKKGKLLPSQIAWNAEFDAAPTCNKARDVAYGFAEARRIIAAWVLVVRGENGGVQPKRK